MKSLTSLLILLLAFKFFFQQRAKPTRLLIR
jgi:hypothetical protein